MQVPFLNLSKLVSDESFDEELDSLSAPLPESLYAQPPAGTRLRWEQAKDGLGRPYWVDHLTNTTHRSLPEKVDGRELVSLPNSCELSTTTGVFFLYVEGDPYRRFRWERETCSRTNLSGKPVASQEFGIEMWIDYYHQQAYETLPTDADLLETIPVSPEWLESEDGQAHRQALFANHRSIHRSGFLRKRMTGIRRSTDGGTKVLKRISPRSRRSLSLHKEESQIVIQSANNDSVCLPSEHVKGRRRASIPTSRVAILRRGSLEPVERVHKRDRDAEVFYPVVGYSCSVGSPALRRIWTPTRYCR